MKTPSLACERPIGNYQHRSLNWGVERSMSKRTAMEMGAAMTDFSAESTRAKGPFLGQDSVERQLNQAVLDAIEIGHQW